MTVPSTNTVQPGSVSHAEFNCTRTAMERAAKATFASLMKAVESDDVAGFQSLFDPEGPLQDYALSPATALKAMQALKAELGGRTATLDSVYGWVPSAPGEITYRIAIDGEIEHGQEIEFNRSLDGRVLIYNA